MPGVTVVVLTYNHERFVAECLESILEQGCEGLEVIHIDNASDDGSASIAGAVLTASDKTTMQIVNPVNIGIPAALNQALAATTTDYVAFISGDDRMTSGRLDRQMELLESVGDDVAAVCGDVTLIDENGERVVLSRGRLESSTPYLADRNTQMLELIRGRVPLAPTAMFRRVCLEHVGRYDESIAVEDYDMWLRLLSAGCAIRYEPEVAAGYRVHSSNLSGDRQLLRRTSLDSLRRLDSGQLGRRERSARRRRLVRLRLALAVGSVQRLKDRRDRRRRPEPVDQRRRPV